MSLTPEEIIKQAQEKLFRYAQKETNDNDPEMIKTASVYMNSNFMAPTKTNTGIRQMPYAAPFTTLSDDKIPNNMHDIFAWCKYMYMFDPLISGAINALASFPITELTLEDKIDHDSNTVPLYSQNPNNKKPNKKEEKSDTLKVYERVLFKTLKIYKLLTEIGIDYFLYGNCFVFGEMMEDPNTKEKEWSRMTRLNPEKMIIDYNPATGDTKYRWTVPKEIVKICQTKKPVEEYEKIPDIIKEAVRENKTVVLNKENIYHLSRPSDSGNDNNVWGIPLGLNVIKLAMYRNILRQAQEAIAREHIVPFRIFYLQKTEDTANPAANWTKAASSLAGEIAKSVADPNYKVVSPLPVGVVETGGNGRSLLLTPEIDQVQGEILAGMNVPKEFIFGGVSYSSSSIALKILENQFITYRLFLSDFVENFIIKGMAIARNEWLSEEDDDQLITATFTDLKMQDDVQQKQLIINLNGAGKVTNEYMWESMGLDADTMRSGIQDEALAAIELEHQVTMERLASNLEQQKTQILQRYLLMVYDYMIKKAFTEKYPEVFQQMQMQEGVQQQGVSSAEGEQQPNEQPQQQEQEQQPQQQDNQKEDEDRAMGLGQAQQMVESQGPQQVPTNSQLDKMAQTLLKMTKEERSIEYSKMPKQLAEKLNQIVNMYEAHMGQNEIDMRPMPEQKPPRRNSLG